MMRNATGLGSETRAWLISAARRPASWAAAAAVVGGVLGSAVILLCLILPVGFAMLACSVDLFFGSVRFSLLLTVSSLAGIGTLLARRSRIPTRVAVVLAGLLSLVTLYWFVTGGSPGLPPLLELVSGELSPLQYDAIVVFWGRPVLVILFGVSLLWFGRWLPALLLFAIGASEALALIILPIFLFHAQWLLILLGAPGTGMGLIEVAGWVLLGAVILVSGKELEEKRLEENRRATGEENRRKARQLYEEVFGAGDFSVVDELVAEDFSDLLHHGQGREGFKRAIEDVYRTFPDLRLSVEEQISEGETVTTRCVLSGTDRGGVLWYPPTNRSVTFIATYVDRFSNGRLVEHRGDVDMNGLLKQLGLPSANEKPVSE